MKNLKRLTFTAFLACCLCLACSSTVLTGSWRDPEYTGGVKKVLVVGVSQNDFIRRQLEDEFTRQLREAGARAEASYAYFNVEQLKDQQEQVEAKVRELGFDQVIVSRLVDRRTEEVVQPGTTYATSYPRGGYVGGWNGYYRESVTYVHQPPVVYRVEVVTIESKLFALGTDKLIWSGLLETELDASAKTGNKESLIRSFVKVVVQDLKKERLL
jgi:hypothetical protein